MAEARGPCGLSSVDMAVDGAKGKAAFVHRPGTLSGHSEGMWTETGVTGDVGVATGVGVEPTRGARPAPKAKMGAGSVSQ